MRYNILCWLLCIILLFQIYPSQKSDDNIELLTCGANQCSSNQGKCVGVPSYQCECFAPFATFPETDTFRCTYKRKEQWLAFGLELIISFGSGHFYTENYKLALPKLIYWVIGYGLFIFLRVVSVKREDNDPVVLMVSLGSCVICIGMAVWQIVDSVVYGMNGYSDGYGIDLLSWGKEKIQ